MANYICHVIIEDLEEDRDSLQCYLVANDNTSAVSHINTLITDVDPLIDGEIVGANLEKVIDVDLPTGLKAAPAAGSRVEEKMALIFESENPNSQQSTIIQLPARLSSGLITGGSTATATFITNATAHFIRTALPRPCDYDFSPLTRLKKAREAYKSRQSRRWG